MEHNPAKIRRAKENFLNAGIQETIQIKEGNAISVLNELSDQEKYRNFFDFVLIDADKENVIKYFDLVFPMVALGGVIITDNMLYPEKYREEMKKYSEYLKRNSNVRTTTSQIGNGEEITVKIK